MQKTLTSVGNSTALTLPQAYLQQLGLHKGSKVNIALIDGKITIEPVNVKPRFTIKELMANTDFDAMREDKELQAWQNKPSVGREHG
ncbi:cell division protein [Vibrio cholerae]|nr:cell division protein [Vibrio cholerae]